MNNYACVYMYVCMHVGLRVNPHKREGVGGRWVSPFAIAIMPEPGLGLVNPTPASLRDAGFAARCGGADMWLLLVCPCVAL